MKREKTVFFFRRSLQFEERGLRGRQHMIMTREANGLKRMTAWSPKSWQLQEDSNNSNGEHHHHPHHQYHHHHHHHHHHHRHRHCHCNDYAHEIHGDGDDADQRRKAYKEEQDQDPVERKKRTNAVMKRRRNQLDEWSDWRKQGIPQMTKGGATVTDYLAGSEREVHVSQPAPRPSDSLKVISKTSSSGEAVGDAAAMES